MKNACLAMAATSIMGYEIQVKCACCLPDKNWNSSISADDFGKKFKHSTEIGCT
jgi:hypothetical protein